MPGVTYDLIIKAIDYYMKKPSVDTIFQSKINIDEEKQLNDYLIENWDKKPFSHMQRETKRHATTLRNIANKIGLGSKPFVWGSRKTHKITLIFDTLTGIYYFNKDEASRAKGYNIKTVSPHLKHNRKYKSLIMVD